MNGRTATLIIRLLPSLKDFAFLMPIAFLFTRMGGTRTMLGDGDTGWHIRTGDWILANGRVPTQDMFSFTKPGEPWFAWEWLWDVIFALLHRWGGLALVVLANVVLLGVIFLLLFRLICRYANPLVALLLTMVAAAASSIHWLARPHLFTLLFTVIFYNILLRASEGRTRLLWVLPPLTVLWTNLHGGFFVGIILAGAFAAGELIGRALRGDGASRTHNWAAARRYLATAAGCLAASLPNPYFYRLHLHLIDYLADAQQKADIAEFLPLNFQHPLALCFEFLLMGGVLAAAWHARRGNYRAVVLLLIWAHGSLIARRNMPIFALLSAPLVAEPLDDWLRRLPASAAARWLTRIGHRLAELGDSAARIENLGRCHIVSVVGVAILAALLFAPTSPAAFRPEFERKEYPAAAIEKLGFGPDTRIFTNDEWGDYLIYRLYPRTRVFVDGRSDFYGGPFGEDYMRVLRVKHDWERILNGFHIDTILLPTGASLAGALKQSQRWRVVYDDGISVVFRQGDAGPQHGTQVSAGKAGGEGRDREITKTEARDQSITDITNRDHYLKGATSI